MGKDRLLKLHAARAGPLSGYVLEKLLYDALTTDIVWLRITWQIQSSASPSALGRVPVKVC